MALVQVQNVEVQNNPGFFVEPLQLVITFECFSPGIQGELEWKLVYIGSAEDQKYDQELESILVGPVAVGKNRFLFEAPPPSHASIPEDDLVDVTALLLTCSYKGNEFIRVGYYVHNYFEEELQAEQHAAAANAPARPRADDAGEDVGEDEEEEDDEEEEEEEEDEGEEEEEEEEVEMGDEASPAAVSSSSTAPAPAAATSPPGGAGGVFAPPVKQRRPKNSVYSRINQLRRNIMHDKPRVTRFNIPWDAPVPLAPAEHSNSNDAGQDVAMA